MEYEKSVLQEIAAGKKKAGIRLLISGIITIIPISLIVYICIYRFGCIAHDTYGWCGFGSFLYSVIIAMFGLVLIAVSISKIINSRIIKKGRKRIDTMAVYRNFSISKEYFRSFVLSFLIYIAMLSILAFFIVISSPGAEVMRLVPFLVFFVSIVAITVIHVKWK